MNCTWKGHRNCTSIYYGCDNICIQILSQLLCAIGHMTRTCCECVVYMEVKYEHGYTGVTHTTMVSFKTKILVLLCSRDDSNKIIKDPPNYCRWMALALFGHCRAVIAHVPDLT